jgi:NADH-quinone oxidoreductase subunit L
MDHELLNLLPVLVPIPPLIAFFVIVLFTNRVRWLSHTISVLAAVLSLVFGVILLVNAVGMEGHELAHEPYGESVPWLPIDGLSRWFKMGAMVDPLTVAMLFFVPLAIFCIIFYSIGYMNYGTEHEDRHYSRFFAFLSLFAFGMCTLVVADNLLLLFVGWEVMGLCSYLLIGFWYYKNYDDPKKITPRDAAFKAFITTRIGDVIMLLGIAFLYTKTGTLSFADILRNEEVLHELSTTMVGGLGISVSGLIGLLLFAGTVGKSAQFPLHVWLPDAMEGPTPVSAMIHSAAMVSAGVYMVVRMFPLLSAGWHHGGPPTAPMVAMGLIGAFTAFFASTIALAQNDIKRVLAYSTIAQLGYMVAALGVGAYVAAAFHLITHAFFKALLFLGSGSVIHGMEHGAEHVHDHHTDAQNMLNMGGLRTKMPWTFWTFFIGGMALSGLPLVTAGFWSKDEILAESFYAMTHGEGGLAGLGAWVFILLAVSAALTAFYTMRQIGLTFLGKPRTKLAEHAHESVWTMLLPLVILAFFALTAGFVGIPDDFLGLELGESNFFHHFVGASLLEHPEGVAFSWIPLLTSIVVVALGLLGGYWVYGMERVKAGEPDPLSKPLGKFYTVLQNKYYFDEFYQWAFVEPTKTIAAKVVYEWMDRGVIDGILHWIGRTTETIAGYFRLFDLHVINGGVDWLKDRFLDAAREFRAIQAGKIQEYMWLSLLIACAFFYMLTYVIPWFNSLLGR